MPKEYLFSPGVTLRENQGNFFIESSDPLRFLRLNRAAYELLEHLGTRSSPIQSGSSQTTEMKTDSFLDGLEKAGYIHLQGSPPETLPSISIIVPVWNRVSELHACVSSLAALSYPLSRIEIIVVDDASSPPVSISLEDVHIKLAVSPVHGGAAHARNLGCRIATGEFVAFIDSDCIARSDWLRELVAYIPEPGIVGGVVNHPGETNIDRYENVRSPLYLGRIGRRLDQGSEFTYLPTCNMLVNRELFEEIGGFDESLPIGEDVDLTWKAALHGGRVRYVPTGAVEHHPSGGLKRFVARYFSYGTSVARLLSKYPKMRSTWRISSLKTLFYVLVISGLILWNSLPILAGGVLPAVEFVRKSYSSRRLHAPVGGARIFGVVLVDYYNSFFELCRGLSRHFSIMLLALALLSQTALVILLTAAAILAIREYVRLKPKVAFPIFLSLYFLEDLVYQLGLWLQCLRSRTLKPLLPSVLRPKS